MNQGNLKICNAKIITPLRTIENGCILVQNGIIKTIAEGSLEGELSGEYNFEVIDAKGNYVSPGFIDIHVHGGGGYDFMDNDPEGFLAIARLHAKHGTTSFTPTTLSCEKADLMETIRIYEQVHNKVSDGAQFSGLHIEGPYFAMDYKGAQPARYIRLPDPEEYHEILDASSCISRWSVAPELDGAAEFGSLLKSKGILPSIGHSGAVFEEVVQAMEHGYSHITHLYCAMSGVTRKNAFRYAGVIESALLMDELTVEIIADGIHLPPSLLKLVYKVKGSDKIALITDSMRAAGMPEGESALGGLNSGIQVIVEDGVAKLPDRSAFAGSVATADLLVRNMVRLADVPLTDAIKMMTTTPASIMGIGDHKGALIEGKDADIVIFDRDIRIIKTIIGGNIVYSGTD